MKNTVTLVGNIGADPKLESKGDLKYLRFSLAVNESYKPKDSDEWKTTTTWFNLVVFGKQAEGLSKVLRKGASVAVSGKLQNKAREVDGKKMWNLEVNVRQVDILTSAKKPLEDLNDDSDMGDDSNGVD